MTEPVARAVSPRRTVRVAVALVAGQAALCAVIGWVTFGPSESEPRAAGVRPLTEPVVLPTPSLTLPPLRAAPAAPETSSSTASSSAAPRSARSSRPLASRATSKPAAEKQRPVLAEDETPPPSPPSEPVAPSPALAASPPAAPIDEVQFPVVEGRRCSPEGAQGRTVKDVELRCAKDADGDLVWQIN